MCELHSEWCGVHAKLARVSKPGKKNSPVPSGTASVLLRSTEEAVALELLELIHASKTQSDRARGGGRRARGRGCELECNRKFRQQTN
jgi:hypothetical protein